MVHGTAPKLILEDVGDALIRSVELFGLSEMELLFPSSDDHLFIGATISRRTLIIIYPIECLSELGSELWRVYHNHNEGECADPGKISKLTDEEFSILQSSMCT